jgi:1-acyl-sn-glycerol-3-phosphate acyltransferase
MRERKKILKPQKWFVWLIKPRLFAFLRKRYNVTLIENDEVRAIRPPFILVGNHVSFWDPFFLHMDIGPTVQYITSDNIFRTLFLGAAMRLLGSIPTSKFKSDIGTVAQVLRVIKNNGVIGVFPEGRRTWDGSKLEHVPTVTKLIHRLRLPVVGVIIKGGVSFKSALGPPYPTRQNRTGIQADFCSGRAENPLPGRSPPPDGEASCP